MANFGLTQLNQPPDDNGRPPMSMSEAWTLGYPGPPTRDREEEGGLVECWRIVKNRKLVLLGCGLLGLALGLLFARAQAPVYQARASFEIQDTNASLPSI